MQQQKSGKKEFSFKHNALEQIAWSDWLQLGILEATIGVVIDISASNKDLGFYWIVVGAIVFFLTTVLYTAGLFRWKNSNSARTFSLVVSIFVLANLLLTLVVFVFTLVRYGSK